MIPRRKDPMVVLEIWQVELLGSRRVSRDECFEAVAHVEAELRRTLRACVSSVALGEGLRVELKR